MARTISQTARTAVYSQSTEEVFVLLMQISNEVDPGQPIRVALDNENLTTKLTASGVDTYSTGVEFIGGYFGIELPEEAGENIQSVRISIGNVDRQIVQAIRLANNPPEVLIWVVLRSTPDIVEAGPYYLILNNADYDATIVTAELRFDDITNRRFPQHDFTPFVTPGLF